MVLDIRGFQLSMDAVAAYGPCAQAGLGAWKAAIPVLGESDERGR